MFSLVDTMQQDHQYSSRNAYKVAVLAFQCLALDGKIRPSMDAVVSVLEGIQEPTDQDRNPAK